MTIPTQITAQLASETMAMVDQVARANGMTGPQCAAEAIRRAVESEADYRAFARLGIDAADRGDVVAR